VLVFDADEFAIGHEQSARRGLERLAVEAERGGREGVLLRIAEVFGLRTDGRPMIRTDGYWDTIKGLRFVRYSNSPLAEQEMGGAPVPPLPTTSIYSKAGIVTLLHYGYATIDDKYAKFERYMSKGNHGHNIHHIQSILTEPRLEVWDGSCPVLGGVRW
jgi:hypothetical protein